MFAFSNLLEHTPSDISLYTVRRSSLLCFCKPFLLEVIRLSPSVVSVLNESTTNQDVRPLAAVNRRQKRP